jgi:hypothetical protein
MALAFQRRGFQMRSLSLFLILTSLTLTASAQEYKTLKAKPYHSESKRSEGKQNKGGAPADKKLTPHASNSQELHRVELQAAKSSASNTAGKHRARKARIVKPAHEKNPPIHFSSAEGTHGSMNNQGKNPYKGRVRQKGNGKH